VEVRVALDTNRLTDLFRGDTSLADHLGGCEEIWIPLMVLGEMRAGFLGGSRQHHNEALLQRFLMKPTVQVQLPDRDTAEVYARLFVQLKRAGTPIPDNDLWIGALALQKDLLLITRDRHFAHIPQLVRSE
jgi:tRNA(fMet)-specific endonuclease VapC